MPVVAFTNQCPKPCLYCDLCLRQFSANQIIASGINGVMDKLVNCKKAYFSAVIDCFLKENQELTHRLLVHTWKFKKNFSPLIITKQVIPDKTIKLLIKNRKYANVFISIPSLNNRILSILEPSPSSVRNHLATIKKLTDGGVSVIAVIMPWFNIYEKNESIDDLPRELAKIGVKKCVIGTGVLPKIQMQKFLNTKDETILKAISKMVEEKQVTTKVGYTFSLEKRLEMFKKIIDALGKYGIEGRVCTADNPDLLGKTKLPLCSKSNQPLCARIPDF